jgi:hypothetical protein
MYQNRKHAALRSHNLEPEPDERPAVRLRNYPELEPDDVRQALAFAAASLEDSAAESNAA